MKLKDKEKKVWEKAAYCDCGCSDCHPNNHRLCSICGSTIMYGSHESVKSQNGSFYAWNIDHIIPRSKGGRDIHENLQAVHIRCNRDKKNK